MNEQQILVLAAALNAIGATQKDLNELAPFQMIDLSKFETKLFASDEITQSGFLPVTKQAHMVRRQPSGKNGCHNF